MNPNADEAEVMLAAVMKGTDDLIWAVDRQHFGLLAMSKGLERYFAEDFGITLRVGMTLPEMLPPKAVEIWLNFYQRLLREGPYATEYESIDKKRLLLLSFERLVAKGCSFGILVYGKDITNQRRAEESLRKSESRFAKVFQSSPDIIVITSLIDGKIVDVNHRAEEALGLTREELIGQSTTDLKIWSSSTERERYLAHLRKHGSVRDMEMHPRTKRGSFTHALISSEPIELNAVPHIVTTVRDITEQKLAEEALREGEARYRMLIESAPEAIVVVHVQSGRFVDCNENACQLYGLDRASLLAMGPAEISPPVQPDGQSSVDSARAWLARAIAGEKPAFEWTHRKPTGEDYPCEVRLTAMPSRQRSLVRASVFDISERKRSEKHAAEIQKRLEQAQRLEALGTLAGGIAHDFNNILGAIIGNTDLALMDLEESSPARELLENVQRGATRAADLVRQILAFSRQTPQDKKPVQLVLVVKEVLKLLRATLPATIAVEEKRSSDGWVLADPGQLHQIVMNLCTNASLAMREHGGVLTVRMYDRKSEPGLLAAHPGLGEGDYVCLEVNDTGCGIPPGNLGRIFEPFFTTRPKGQGTGLGLSVVHGIVKSAGGSVAVTSEVGKGTTFEIVLPACRPISTEQPIPQKPARGHARVLFVDDELALTEVARTGLARLGHSITTYNDPMLALESFRTQPDDYDIVVTDMTMPKLTGDVLATEVRRVRNDIPIILVSGFSERMTPQQAKAAGFAGFIDKPVRPSTLAEIVDRLCAPRS